MTMHHLRYDVAQVRPSHVLAVDDLSVNIPDVAPVGWGQLKASLREARSAFGVNLAPREDSSRGWKSDGLVLRRGRLDAFQRRQDAADLERLMKGHSGSWDGIRADYAAYVERRRDSGTGFVPGGTAGFPRDFEYIRAEIWEEERQPLTALSLFPQYTGVPLGARTHTARRRLARGAARIMRGDSFVPRANIAYVEEQFGVIYIVCGVGQNFFETLTTDFASLDAYKEGLREAVRLVDERVNDVLWYGDPASKVYGVLNYPSLAKTLLPLAYDDTVASPPDPKDLITQLHDLSNVPRVRSGTRFKPNRLAISPAMMSYLSTRKHELNGGTDTTMLQYFLATNTLGIKQAEEAPELSGVGPDGEDGILFYRDDQDSIHATMLQAPTTLPVYQSSPLDQITVVYAAIGGIVCGNVGNHILGYARVRSF